jgi:hypothetical protein
VSEPPGWNWESFLEELMPYVERFSGDWEGLFGVLAECKLIWGEIVEREAGIESDRPQDFVAAILATQSFRVALSDLLLQVSGYSDEAIGLDRTLDEIWLRLSLLVEEPEKGALGFYYAYVCLEMDVLRMHLSRPRAGEENLLKGFREDLARLEDYREQVRKLIGERGYRAKELKERYGKVRLAKAARALDPEAGRDHRFRAAAQSAYIHARGFGIDRFILSHTPRRVFSIGPVYDNLTIMRIRETIGQLLDNLELASILVGIQGIGPRAAGARDRLRSALHRIFKEQR